METIAGTPSLEYRFVREEDPAAMLKAITAAAEQGYRISGDVGSLGILLQRDVRPAK